MYLRPGALAGTAVIPTTERTLPSYCHLLGRSRPRKTLPEVSFDPRTSHTKRERTCQLRHKGGDSAKKFVDLNFISVQIYLSGISCTERPGFP